MPVIFERIARKKPKRNPSDPDVIKYYASVNTISKVSLHEVASLVADETTLNPKEAEMALVQMGKILLRLLQNGQSVELGDFASFYLTVKSEGAETKEDCTAACIKKVNVNCRFSKKFREDIADTKFVPAKKFNKGN